MPFASGSAVVYPENNCDFHQLLCVWPLSLDAVNFDIAPRRRTQGVFRLQALVFNRFTCRLIFQCSHVKCGNRQVLQIKSHRRQDFSSGFPACRIFKEHPLRQLLDFFCQRLLTMKNRVSRSRRFSHLTDFRLRFPLFPRSLIRLSPVFSAPVPGFLHTAPCRTSQCFPFPLQRLFCFWSSSCRTNPKSG